MIEVEDFEATVEAEWAHVQSLHPDKTLDQLKKEARMQRAHDKAVAQKQAKTLAQRQKAWCREARLWAADTGSDEDDYEFFVPYPRD